MQTTLRYFLIVALAVTCSSCLDIETSTEVHHDGSLTRTLVFSGDSSSMAGRKFPLPFDSTWKVSTSRTDEKTTVLRAERSFIDVAAMNRAMVGEPGKTLTVISKLDKSFQWFFTVYRYTETWKCYRIVEAVPFSAYLSDRDLDMAYHHIIRKEPTSADDSLYLEGVEKRHNAWNERNLFEAYFREFRKGVEMVGSPRFSVAKADKEKDRLFTGTAKELLKEKPSVIRAQKAFASILRSPVVGKVFRANVRGFDSLKTMLDFEQAGHGSGCKASVTMPGPIVSSNAERVEGSTAHWEDVFSLNYFRDVDLRVESRAINWWAVMATGGVVTAILARLLIVFLRRKPRAL